MIAVTFLAHSVSSMIFRHCTVSESSDFQTPFCALIAELCQLCKLLVAPYVSSIIFYHFMINLSVSILIISRYTVSFLRVCKSALCELSCAVGPCVSSEIFCWRIVQVP